MLALGDLLAIYNMFNKVDRIEFTKWFLNKSKVRANQISRVSSKINKIREIRNNINHYEPIIPTLISRVNNNEDTAILVLSKNLKDIYLRGEIKSIKTVKYKKYEKCRKNDYNKKYIILINKLVRIL